MNTAAWQEMQTNSPQVGDMQDCASVQNIAAFALSILHWQEEVSPVVHTTKSKQKTCHATWWWKKPLEMGPAAALWQSLTDACILHWKQDECCTFFVMQSCILQQLSKLVRKLAHNHNVFFQVQQLSDKQAGSLLAALHSKMGVKALLKWGLASSSVD
jgi:hypothetical protein